MPGVVAERGYPNEAGQPFGRVLITLTADAAISRDDLVKKLWQGDPCIAVSEVGADKIGLNPQTVQESEIDVVLNAVRAALEGK